VSLVSVAILAILGSCVVDLTAAQKLAWRRPALTPEVSPDASVSLNERAP